MRHNGVQDPGDRSLSTKESNSPFPSEVEEKKGRLQRVGMLLEVAKDLKASS